MRDRARSDRARAVIVLAKEPVPGRVKTRLSPAFSPDQAAQLAAAALTDTLTAVRASAARHRVLAWDGDPDGWRAGFALVRQPPGDLAGRLEAAFADTFDRVLTGGRPEDGALLIGMDTPQVGARSPRCELGTARTPCSDSATTAGSGRSGCDVTGRPGSSAAYRCPRRGPEPRSSPA